ncbi:hypothetical protein SAMN04487972_107138 [Paracoccus halophilus]|uniref:DUF4424 domain-containing protein n=1 Tax=Paracoccus halophilus TaxID=376733 RepID=A0A099EXY3_9RHOB|nr:DUF6497 family protein [Paracoccus halophilus]KGJ03034.1 hypothetical protein IT41_15585 [Paracoccus halophilus]SFA50334.1 hypothetical protein SAMN04487972_107138 [Paracoccus halophilus]
MKGTERIRQALAAGVMLAALAAAPGATALDGTGQEIVLPSGARVRWQETLHDSTNSLGLTYRFRFVMPDLAQQVPATSGAASDFEDAGGPIDIGTETGGDAAVAVEIAPLPGAPATAPQTGSQPQEPDVVPAAPDVLAQDPVHQDIVWLCENWVLPRVASPAPRPTRIIISLVDKETPFDGYDPEVVQLSEAFRLPAGGDRCEWEPW